MRGMLTGFAVVGKSLDTRLCKWLESLAGGMAERLKAAVLKTYLGHSSKGADILHNIYNII